MPQVQYVATFEEKQAAARAASAPRQKAGPRSYRPTGKRGGGAVNSNGLSVALIVLAILVVGVAGFGVGGYFVYKAIKGHQDARVQMATSLYDFEKHDRPLAAPPPRPGAAPAAGGGTLTSSPLTNKPTREDLEKLQKFLDGLEEASARLTKDYEKDLNKTGINQLLVADRIAADKDFSQSRLIIAAAREVITKHRHIAEMEDTAIIEDLARIKFQGVPTEVMVGRFRAMTQEAQPEMDRIRAMDGAIATQYEEAIKHLEATRGSWRLEGESVVFNDSRHAERYKAFFDEVDKCAQTKVDLLNKIGQDALPKWKAMGFVN